MRSHLRSRDSVALLALAMFLSGLGARAEAQSDALETAQRALDRADFAAAIEAYDEAAASDGLSRDDLVRLLSGRALAHHASRNATLLERDLAALLSLDPTVELGRTAPPALRRDLERLRGEVSEPLALEAEVNRIPDGFEVRLSVHQDATSLVRETRVYYQTDGAWSVEPGPRARIVAGARLVYYAEAIGPGGAVIATVGDRDAPRTEEATLTGAAAAPSETAPVVGDDSVAIGVGVGVTLGVLVIGGVVAAILAVLLGGQGNTRPSAPMELP